MSCRRPLALFAAIAIAACTATNPATPPIEGSPQPPPSSWKRTMKQVEKHFLVVEAELSKTPTGDLRATFRGGKQQFCARCDDAAKVKPW